MGKNEIKQLMELWNNEYPNTLEYSHISEFQIYLQKLGDQHHYLLGEGKNIYGWCFTFDRDDERYFAIIVSRAQQGYGWGKKLLEKAKSDSESLTGWVIDGDTYIRVDGTSYISPLKFYRKQGFKLYPDERLEIHSISAVKIRWQMREEM